MLTLLSLNPPTGEKPLSGWIIAIIIIAALFLAASAILPFLPKIIAFLKNKLEEIKGNKKQ